MCRAGGRRCPSHSNPQAIVARNARRREQYFRKVHQSSTNPEILSNGSTVISEQQKEYFKNSKASLNGELIPIYHGSQTEFNSFNPEMLGKGNDTWGNGFYFTDQKSIAEGYANDSNSETANVKEFYVNLTNPMYVDGKEKSSLMDIHFTSQQIANILKQHPTAYLQPDNEDDMNFLGDYSSSYWDKDHYTKEEFDTMIDNVAKEHFSDANWVALEVMYGKEHGSAFLHAIHKETGHDGVIVDFGENESKHYIAWFPEQMKLTNNTEPTDNHMF